MSGPLPRLQFCPTGGITADAASDYLALSSAPCVGGSWLTPPSALCDGAWEVVEDLVRGAFGLA